MFGWFQIKTTVISLILGFVNNVDLLLNYKQHSFIAFFLD